MRLDPATEVGEGGDLVGGQHPRRPPFGVDRDGPATAGGQQGPLLTDAQLAEMLALGRGAIRQLIEMQNAAVTV